MQLLTRRALAAALTASVSLLPPRPALAKYGGWGMTDVLGKSDADDGCRSISGCASNRAAMPFTVELPDDFVTIPASGRAKSDFLLVSGNFGTGGGTTGVSTLSVQRAVAPADAADVAALAAALTAARDATTGYRTAVLSDTVRVEDDGRRITFETRTPLATGATEASSTFVRHGLGVVLAQIPWLPDAPSEAPLLVLWAGAREDEWVDGVGAKLAKAAATFRPVRDS
jgi:hypothetical protein